MARRRGGMIEPRQAASADQIIEHSCVNQTTAAVVGSRNDERHRSCAAGSWLRTVREWTRATREAQGLPPQITDISTYEQLAAVATRAQRIDTSVGATRARQVVAGRD